MDQPQISTSVLDRLSPEVHACLTALGHDVDVPANAVILREGDETPFLGVVTAGRIALRLRVPELGERVTFVTCEAGELFGWSAVVSPFRTTADAVATEPTSFVAFDAPELRVCLAANPALAAELLPLVLESVSTRLTASWAQLLDMFGPRAQEPW
jgi:CRP-like cAMP-binding protein